MKNIALLFVLGLFLISACSQQQSVVEQEEVTGAQMPVPETNTQETKAADNQAIPGTGTEETEAAAEESMEQPASQAPSDVREFKITAERFTFTPEVIEINRGDKVRLIVTSKDVPHGFAIREYGINEKLQVGEPVTIEFTADKEGTFTAYCSVFCGSGHGNMKGKLIVR